jgi:hypothetical protein
MGAEAGKSEGGMAAERQLAQLNQDRLTEMQARSERLRATMVALAAEAKSLLHARHDALSALPPVERKRRRRKP